VSAREEILGRVRAALAGAERSVVTVPRGYRHIEPPTDVVGLFCDRAADYRATVVRCREDEVAGRIAQALAGTTRVVVPDGLPWHVPNAEVDTGLTAPELDEVDAVVTGARVGIAETGTLVLTHGPGEGRRALSLVPDRHVCLVRAEQIVPGVPDAVAALDRDRPTTWISGPSATSDIELSRVEGVHGPRNLHVIVVGAPE
jgi:L-lactate dehydrogenase complex protein LldG